MTERDRLARLGSYVPNRFIGRTEVPIDGQTLDAESQSVLLHEYWHYLQNISTTSGVDSFLAYQTLLALFSATLVPHADGSSGGSALLPAEALETVRKLLSTRREVAGDRGPTGRLGSTEIVGHVVATSGALITVEVEKRRQRMEPQQYRLGSLAIEESVAHLVEQQFRVLVGAKATPSPEYPYRALERISRFVLGIDEDPVIVAALGTLALLSEKPGGRFVTLVEAHRKLRPTLGALGSIRQLAASMPKIVDAGMSATLQGVSSVEAMHASRGMSERAARHYATEIRRGLDRRLSNTLFDLEPLLLPSLTPEDRIERFAALTSDFLPCEFIIRLPDANGNVTPVVVAFGAERLENDLDLAQHTRSFDAQLHHMLSHLNASGAFVASASLQQIECPFLASCTHPSKSKRPSHCRIAPWRHVSEPEPGCWYSNGVSASLGRVKIKKA